MKTIFKYALAVLSPMMLFSCQKEASDVLDINVPEAKTITLTCRIADDTKVSIDGTGKTAWEVGDKIYVHGSQGMDANLGQVVTLTSADIHDGGKIATLTFSEENVPAYTREDCVSSYYACYPADAVDPAYYMYYYGIYKETNVPLMQGYDDGNGNMIFMNLCAAISFTVDGDFDSYTFCGNGSEDVGYSHVSARLALRSDGVNLKWDIPYDSDLHSSEKNSAPLTEISGSVVSDGTTSNFIYIFNGANFTNGFTIKFYKLGVEKKVLSTHSAINLERNEYKNLGDVTSYLKDSAEPAPELPTITIDGVMSDWDAVTTGISSAGGPYYEFKATFDETYLYFYSKRDFRNTYWGGNGYFYYDFDIDNNTETGITKDSIPGVDAYIYIKPFGGSNDDPAIITTPSGELCPKDGTQKAYTCETDSCAGVIGAQYVEIECKIARTDIGVKFGDNLRIYTWCNKDGANLKSSYILLPLFK